MSPLSGTQVRSSDSSSALLKQALKVSWCFCVSSHKKHFAAEKIIGTAISCEPQRFNFTLLLKKSWHVLCRYCDYDVMAQLVTWKHMFKRHRQSYFQLFSYRDSRVSFKKFLSWLHLCTTLNCLLHQFLPAGQGENFVPADLVFQIPPGKC